MDKSCNPENSILKKNLGSFYTPEPYAEKAAELLLEAVSRVPAGNDYIILDRCAGTGNLEAPLSEELLSHCILSSLENEEHELLKARFSGKVRHILPPSDALSRDFLENPLITQYLQKKDCSVILYENPPFAETTSIEHQKAAQARLSSLWKQSYLPQEIKKEIKGPASNDLSNVFIWSGFKYYLQKPSDFYIVFAPLKYWKVQKLVNKHFIKGFGFNRRHFNTRVDACIMAALWSNEDDYTQSHIELEGYDIGPDNKLSSMQLLPADKIHSLYSQLYYDKRPFPDESYDGIILRLNGFEDTSGGKARLKPLYSSQMLGYLVADSAGFDNPDSKSSLLSAGRYNGNGFYLHRDNFLIKLPMFAASRYACYNRSWTERGRIMKSADGAERFNADAKSGKLRQWLLRCLLFCCLDFQNHMRSFYGSDGRYYRNELCLDMNKGETLAVKKLRALRLRKQEKALISQWQRIFARAQDCPQ